MNRTTRLILTGRALEEASEPLKQKESVFRQAQESLIRAEAELKEEQEAYYAATASLLSFYAKRIEAQRAVIDCVVTKLNRGRTHDKWVLLAEYEWARQTGAIEVLGLSKDGVHFRFTDAGGQAPVHTMSHEQIHYSVREQAKRVRRSMWEERNRLKREALQAQILELEKETKALRETMEKERREAQALVARRLNEARRLEERRAALETV